MILLFLPCDAHNKEDNFTLKKSGKIIIGAP